MNKFVFGVLAAALLWAGQGQAHQRELTTDLAVAHLQAGIQSQMDAFNVINWEVGENSQYKLTSTFGDLGTMQKRVDREQGNAVWIITETAGQIGNKRIEMLIDRATGETLEYIEDGERKQPPSNDDFEIIDQTEDRVTVPAGTFDTIKITGRSSQVRRLEIWFNPRDVVMEGTVQMKADTGFLPVTMKLMSFARP